MTHPVTRATERSLPAAWYCDPQVFLQERQQIFAQHWALVARSDQVARAGSCLATRLAVWPIIVRRGSNGALTGFHNVCRHRAGPLLRDGESRTGDFVCQYHGWRYGECGELKFAPGLENGKDLDYEALSLYPVRVDEWNGMVFACLSDAAPPLRTWLGEITTIAEAFPSANDMVYCGEAVNGGAVNWKTYADNSCEGYHVPMVHRSLGDAVDAQSTEIRAYEQGEFVGFDVTYVDSAADVTRTGKGFWVYKFPTTLLHFAEDSFNAESVRPMAANRIEIVRWFWVDRAAAEARNADPKDFVASSDQVMAEDMEICARVQENLDAGIYKEGLLSARDEPGTIYFQSLVRAALESDELAQASSNS